MLQHPERERNKRERERKREGERDREREPEMCLTQQVLTKKIKEKDIKYLQKSKVKSQSITLQNEKNNPFGLSRQNEKVSLSIHGLGFVISLSDYQRQ